MMVPGRRRNLAKRVVYLTGVALLGLPFACAADGTTTAPTPGVSATPSAPDVGPANGGSAPGRGGTGSSAEGAALHDAHGGRPSAAGTPSTAGAPPAGAGGEGVGAGIGGTPPDCSGDVEGVWDAIPDGGAPLASGPLVGHVTDGSARVWAYSAEGTDVHLMVQRQGTCPGKPVTVPMPPRGDHNGTSLGVVAGLTDDRPYRYQVIVDGRVSATGTFRTAPAEDRPVRFRYAFGSCIRLQRHPEQKVWDDVLEQNPSFQILAGDTVYSDTTEYDGIWRRHTQQRALRNFAEVIRQVPTYATWDDHDYGKNNGDGSLANKDRSLRAWTDVWANPAYGTENTDGVFFSFKWGDVEFFVVDNRYHRTPGAYLGDAQMTWLLQGLRASTAVFKVIVHGGTIRRAGDESWFTRDGERRQLMAAIRDEGVHGVVFHGGDVHKNHFNPYPRCPRAEGPEFDVFEIVSSGMSYTDRFAMIEIDTKVTPPTLVYEFHEAGGRVELATLSLQADGTLVRTVSEPRAPDDECQQTMPAVVSGFPQ